MENLDRQNIESKFLSLVKESALLYKASFLLFVGVSGLRIIPGLLERFLTQGLNSWWAINIIETLSFFLQTWLMVFLAIIVIRKLYKSPIALEEIILQTKKSYWKIVKSSFIFLIAITFPLTAIRALFRLSRITMLGIIFISSGYVTPILFFLVFTILLDENNQNPITSSKFLVDKNLPIALLLGYLDVVIFLLPDIIMLLAKSFTPSSITLMLMGGYRVLALPFLLSMSAILYTYLREKRPQQ